MRKFIIILMAVALIGFGSTSFAASGSLDTDVAAGNDDHSSAFDFSFSPLGIAVGGGSMDAAMSGDAKGFIFNGTIDADLPLAGNVAGGNSQSGTTANLGTWTQNLAVAGAQLDLGASTPSIGLGSVKGDASGYAKQSSHNLGGGIANGGLTGGIAAQESAGGFGGDAKAAVVLFWGGDAGFDASMTHVGYSETNSYTLSESFGKGLGTRVEADTFVTTDSSSYDNGIAHADVGGGFKASGAVETGTIQSRNGGYAAANAEGAYSGSASLGKTYNGSAIGYSETFGNNNGVMQSGAGMTVTSTISNTP